MPMNAPEGAVPARAYEIPAPDLSRGNNHYVEGANEESSQMTDYFQGHSSRVLALPISHSDKFLSRTDSDTHHRDMYKGNSEEVVSAVVLVKQK
jgi:hypothetical protein